MKILWYKNKTKSKDEIHSTSCWSSEYFEITQRIMKSLYILIVSSVFLTKAFALPSNWTTRMQEYGGKCPLFSILFSSIVLLENCMF